MRGSCLCGGVRFELTAPFARANHCHCSRCRKESGAFGLTNGRVPREGFRLLAGEDLLRVYRPAGAVKVFCTVCGSSLFGGSWPDGDLITVRFGALDDDPGKAPSSTPGWSRARGGRSCRTTGCRGTPSTRRTASRVGELGRDRAGGLRRRRRAAQVAVMGRFGERIGVAAALAFSTALTAVLAVACSSWPRGACTATPTRCGSRCGCGRAARWGCSSSSRSPTPGRASARPPRWRSSSPASSRRPS